MSLDPSLALQDAVYTAIKTLAGGKVFYRVPAKQPLPYIYIGADDMQSDYEAGDFTEATVTIDVFSKDKLELKAFVGQVRAALDRAISIEGFTVLEWEFDRTNYITGGDGLTEQASMQFIYLIAAAE